MNLTVRSQRVVVPGAMAPATIHVRDGVIAAVGAYGESMTADVTLDVGSLVVFPGLVDTHVHVNEPGRTEWEGFAHATSAAAAGGVTTIVDMPLNSVPATTTVSALEEKRAAARGQCRVDVGFWGGVVPGNVADLPALAAAGVRGFKCFLVPSGIEEFGHVGEEDLRAAFPVLAALDLPLLVHAEAPDLLCEPVVHGPTDARRYDTWLASRPDSSERAAIERLIALSAEFGGRVHIVHLASAEAVPPLKHSRSGGLRVTVETCPHYLVFSAEEIADGATAFKCAPPIRSQANRELLWAALLDGDIDLIATDHSPAPPSLKHLSDGDFIRAWGGIASLQLSLSAVWTEAAKRDVPVFQLAEWLASAPARLAGLDAKGAIAPGKDADLVVWDPDAETKIDARTLHHRHPVTPYDGRTLRGRVVTTMLRGQVVFGDGQVSGPPAGKLL
jgi:allantoinase